MGKAFSTVLANWLLQFEHQKVICHSNITSSILIVQVRCIAFIFKCSNSVGTFQTN